MMIAGMLACAGISSGAAPASAAAINANHPGSFKINAGKSYQDIALKLELMKPVGNYGPPRPSWIKPNQRQIRLARRRANAAGKRNAFA
jgi:hypothetical protein